MAAASGIDSEIEKLGPKEEEDEPMNKNSRTLWTPALAVALGLLLVAPALAGTAPRDPNLNGGVVLGPLADAPSGPGANWIDHFDTYATGSQMHLQGGWKGWDNSPAAGALTSATQARSAPNSVDILGASDLVHEYTGYTAGTGTWTYTAWMYLPTGSTGTTYFIMLNTYADGGPNNWSVQVQFNNATGTLTNDGTSGGSLPIVYDQWVKIEVVIDLNSDIQTFSYNGAVLYSGTWSGQVSGGGVVNIAAVDLFANGASSAFWDDISLSNLPFVDGFESESTIEWHYTTP